MALNSDIIERIRSRLSYTSVSGSKDNLPRDEGVIAIIEDKYLAEDESLSRLASADGSRIVIVLRVNLFSSNELRELTERIDQWSVINLPAGITQRATGSIILLNDASDAVAASQSSSLAIALVTIYLMMVGLFRSKPELGKHPINLPGCKTSRRNLAPPWRSCYRARRRILHGAKHCSYCRECGKWRQRRDCIAWAGAVLRGRNASRN